MESSLLLVVKRVKGCDSAIAKDWKWSQNHSVKTKLSYGCQIKEEHKKKIKIGMNQERYDGAEMTQKIGDFFRSMDSDS